MNIQLGNLVTFTALGNKEKLQELEDKLKEFGYQNESNCEANTDTERLTWHIYDMPRVINFSVLNPDVIKLLQEYSEYFDGRVAVTATKNN